MKAVAKIADAAGALLIVDNAFASPALQRPMESGAHIVVHSSTKYIDGQGRAMGGVILCKEGFPQGPSADLPTQHRPHHEPVQCVAASEEPGDPRPAHARPLRNAQKVADFLAEQKKVLRVLYPFRADHPQHNLARAQMDAAAAS